MAYSPTRLALALALALCVLATGALADPALFRPWLTALLLAAAALALDMLLLPRGAVLELSRRLPTEAGVGAPFTQELTLANSGPAILRALRVTPTGEICAEPQA